MEDARSLMVVQLAALLIARGGRHYHGRTLAEVAAEILGTADGITATKPESRR